MLDTHRLRVFRSVVASGSVQAAAAHLGYTPSAVSQHINQLQRETGLTLFEKAGRGISPTPVGRILAQESDEAMNALSRLGEMVTDLRTGRTGTLTIACFSSAGEEWIPRLVAQLQREFPDVIITVDLNEMTNDSRSTTDLDIRTEDPTETYSASTGYTRHALLTEPYVAVLPADHELAPRDSITLSEVAEQPWVDESIPDQTCSRILRRALAQIGAKPRVVARCQDHHTAFALAAAGVGVTLVPELTTGALPKGTAAVPVYEPEIRRGIAVHVRDAAAGNPVTQRALQILREIATAN
jgi:DNA-binding transcriptional LysR family regulator